MSANRQLSAVSIQYGTGSNVLSLPNANDTLVSLAATQTLSNKTLVAPALGTPASGNLANCTAFPAANLSGQVGVANGGTGLSSGTSGGVLAFSASGTLVSSGALTANQLVIGGGAGAAPSVLAAGTQYQVLVMGASNPGYGALALNQSAAVSGQLGVANGGTGASSLTAHYVMIGNGTSAVTMVSPSTAGLVLTSNGTGSDPSFQAPAAPAPSLNGGSGSPQSVTAAGGVSLSSVGYQNFAWVVGDSSSAVVVTATPSIAAGSADGQILRVIGTDNTATVKLQDQANLASSGLSLNGDIVLAKDMVIELFWDNTQSLWIEMNRSK